ncbi:MAG: hypothetical protein AAGA48_17880 [Myxococcota bacterium]
MRTAALSVAVTALSFPGTALACSVCFSATEENRQAFFDATVLLTFLPLLMLGSGVYWVYRQVS